jgi:glucose/arabinose dehydrogenase
MHPRRRLPSLETLELRDVPATLPPGFTETAAATGIANATAMEFSPDGKLFVAQQNGVMQVWQNGARLRANFFANAPLAVDFFGERGLLGIAFDPNYAANRFVYVYYTTTAADDHNRVSRFTANAAGDLALAGSEVPIWEGDPHPAGNHNGGAIHFGPDGKLFIATGDNANAGNPGPTHYAQSLTSLHGKILRINSNGTIPADNPFVNQTNGRFEAIWALGLRNPFTFSFQQGTGRLFVNDVGQNTWEEINVGVPGSNYGWPGIEGPTGTPPAGPGTYRAPVYFYDHGGAEPNGAAITGGAFYNPTTNTFGPAYLGDYFFSDFGGGWIYRLDFNPATGQFATTPALFASGIAAPVDLKTDNAGNLYYLSIGEQRVMRISPSQAPTITQQPQSRTVSLGSPVAFAVTASGPGLNYQWQRADAATPNAFASIPGAVNASFGIGAAQLGDNGDRFRVIVSNAGGSVVSAAATLTVVNNSPPAVNIGVSSGLRNGRFDAGSPITFLGAANDPETGQLGGSSMRWRVDYLTTTASGDLDGDGLPGLTRPFVPEFTNATGGAFTPATTGPYTLADVAYVIRLSVTDPAGLTTNQVAVLSPNTATVTLRSNPPGVTLTRDGQPVIGPNAFTGVVGFQRVIGAPLTHSAGVVGYQFLNWSDGGAATHTIATPVTNTTYTANYRATSLSGPVRYEAEHLGRTGYVVEANGSASGGRLVRTAVGGGGVARGVFQGPTGRYLVHVVHYDENDGGGEMAFLLNGAQAAGWSLAQNRGSPNPDARTRVLRNLGLFSLTQGTPFAVVGASSGGDLARFDVIQFSRVDDRLAQAFNFGGGDRGPFRGIAGGLSASVPNPIDTSGAVAPAPQAVYQSWQGAPTLRYGFGGLRAGASYRVRLHFSENVVTAAGVCVFDAVINGATVLDNFDVFAAAGRRFKAVVREVTVTADGFGQFTLELLASAGRARINGLEVFEA